MTMNWLRVFRSVNVAHLPYGGGQARETTAVPAEKCMACRGSAYDDMRMITASFARMFPRGIDDLFRYFYLIV